MSLRRAFADSPRPAVLLLGWLGSRDQHFNKYARLYQVRRSVQKLGARGGRANRTGNCAAAAACHCLSAVCGACFGAAAPTSPRALIGTWAPGVALQQQRLVSTSNPWAFHACTGLVAGVQQKRRAPHPTAPNPIQPSFPIQKEQDPCVPLCCCRTLGRR